MKYKFEDVQVGDSVFFKTKHQDNYDLYWTVTHILGKEKRFRVEVKDMGKDDSWIISADEIIRIEVRKEDTQEKKE